MNSIENSRFLGGVQNKEWTYEENKLFQNALAELNIDSPSFFETIMAILPWKTMDEIKYRYEQLINDVLLIEAGNFSANNFSVVRHDNVDNNNNNNNINNNNNNNNATNVGVAENKRKGVPWTEEEHRSFLQGLQNCGKGEWRNISKYYVPSKTTSQVASHAQKYFRRIKCKTPIEKRRHSIHDIRILNDSTITYTAARNPNHHLNYPPNHDPLLPSHENYNYGYGFNYNYGEIVNNDKSVECEASNVGSSNGNKNKNVEMMRSGENNVRELYEYEYEYGGYEQYWSTPSDWFSTTQPTTTHQMPYFY
ncbi:hypothetical protein vseg_005143 [Gypsophila vaccaria]